MEAERYEEGFDLAQAAAASARSQREVLLALRLQERAFMDIGDKAGALQMMRQELAIGEQCRSLFTGNQLDSLRSHIPAFEHLLKGGSLENYRPN